MQWLTDIYDQEWLPASWQTWPVTEEIGFMTWCPPVPCIRNGRITPEMLRQAGMVEVRQTDIAHILKLGGCGYQVADSPEKVTFWAHPVEIAVALRQRLILGFPLLGRQPPQWPMHLPPPTYGMLALRVQDDMLSCIALQALAPGGRKVQSQIAQLVQQAYRDVGGYAQPHTMVGLLEALYPLMATLMQEYEMHLHLPDGAIPLDEMSRGRPLTRQWYVRSAGKLQYQNPASK